MWVVPHLRPDYLTYTGSLLLRKPVYLLTLLFLSSVNQFGLGASFYRGAYKSIVNGSANMDTLVALGTSAAWSLEWSISL